MVLKTRAFLLKNFTAIRKILFVYDHFYPAYRAGGPIQSLTNLAKALQHDYEISVVTGACDHNTAVTLQGINTANWSSVNLPGAKTSIAVYYAIKKKVTKHFFSSLLLHNKPDVVYLNGIFSYRFVIIPLLAVNKLKTKVVLCPRGMLQSGALAGKSFKKKIFLKTLKLSGLVKNITWHATNTEEAGDIKKIFGSNANVIVAGNIPKQPFDTIATPDKKAGELRLVYLSLIAAKKNLLQLIELVNKSSNISLDIYGPVKDKIYWQTCKQAIADGKGNIIYKGDLQPAQVQQTFALYDASVLLTKGENFGHALYESLSAGRPLITSFFTPWNNLEENEAGWNLDIGNDETCLVKLQSIAAMSYDTFSSYCNGAHELAKAYYKTSADLSNYNQLFGAD